MNVGLEKLLDSTEPELSFESSDIERKLGLPAGKFTSPGVALPLVMTVLFTVGFYSLLYLFPNSTAYVMFTQRGIIPYTIVFLAFWSMSILLVKNCKISLQRRAINLSIIPADTPGFVLTPLSADQIIATLYKKVDDPEKFLLTRRIFIALSNLKNLGQVADVGEILRSQTQTDEDTIDSSYTVLRGFIWAIPVLGFIGTVWGLSIALGYLGGILSKSNNLTDLKSALQSVTVGLSTAFETTLEGLVAALFIHLFMVAIRRKEENFLDECSQYCQKYIVGKLKLFEYPTEK